MISIQQDLTPEDYRHAVFLHMRPRPIIGYAGILILAFFLIVFIWKLFSPERWEYDTFIFIGIILYFGLYFSVIIPMRANKSFSQNRFLKDHSECDIDDAGLHIRSNLVNSNIPWDHLYKWKENKKMILLYPTDTMYFIFPKHLFSDEGWNGFRDLTKKNLKKIC